MQTRAPQQSWKTSTMHVLQKPTLRQEWRSVALLVLLYMIQGVPLGLSMGSM
jgi:hypothetical protein